MFLFTPTSTTGFFPLLRALCCGPAPGTVFEEVSEDTGECQETADQDGKEQCQICSVFSLTPNPVFLPERILAAGCSWKAFAISALIVGGAAHVHVGLQVWSDALLPHPIVLFWALVVFGHCSLLQQHWKGREKAAPALLVCRARTRLFLLVLKK